MTGEKTPSGSRLSRRDFLVAGGVSLGLSATVPSLASVATLDTPWDLEADVVVIGSGAAASTAAISAIEGGAQVIMLEKSPVLGGTTAKSGGAFWIPNNFRMKQRGVADPKVPFLSYCASYSFPHLFDPASATLGLPDDAFALLEAYYDNASVMVELLRCTDALNVGAFLLPDPDDNGAGIPDYGPLDGYNQAPRGRCIGVRKPDGSPGFGPEMIRQFNVKFDALKVPRLTRHCVTGVVLDQHGAVVGVEALNGERRVRVHASRGVVFGTGGFAYNRELLNRFHIAPVFGGCGVATNTGDFVAIAGTIGARLGNMASAWRAQQVLEEVLQYLTVPTDVWSPPGDSMILVNKYGKRALNEKRNYQDRTRASLAYDANRWEFPNQLMFMLYDQRTADMYAGIHPIPDLPTGSSAVITAHTWSGLADRLDERLAELSSQTGAVRLAPTFAKELGRTLEKFNRFAAAGKDEDFQRGDFAYDVETRPMFGLPRLDTKWGGESERNVTMHPMQDKGPFYAIILAPGVLDTNGGPVINANAQVMRQDGTPIPGLYGAGNCIASPSHDTYWGMGGTLGPAMTFGFIAGRHAASRK